MAEHTWPRLTAHEMARRDRALAHNAAQFETLDAELESLRDAIRGLQSTDHPSLVPLHDEMMAKLQALENAYRGGATPIVPAPHQLQTVIAGLPAEAQKEFWEAIHKAILWRGWDRTGGLLGSGPCRCHACEGIRQVAELGNKHGIAFEEYT